MNKLFLVSLLLILGVSLVSVSLVSASYDYNPVCRDSYRYYKDCDTYDIANKASVPIFKGPYGNYRYQGYANGDVRPNFFFRSYGGGGYGPYFGGGYGGNYYNSFNSGFGFYGSGGIGYGGFGYSNYRPGPYFKA